MHTFHANGLDVLHNGAFEDDAILVVQTHQVKDMGGGFFHVTVSVDDLVEFVAEKVRRLRMAKLEDASADEILTGEVK